MSASSFSLKASMRAVVYSDRCKVFFTLSGVISISKSYGSKTKLWSSEKINNPSVVVAAQDLPKVQKGVMCTILELYQKRGGEISNCDNHQELTCEVNASVMNEIESLFCLSSVNINKTM